MHSDNNKTIAPMLFVFQTCLRCLLTPSVTLRTCSLFSFFNNYWFVWLDNLCAGKIGFTQLNSMVFFLSFLPIFKCVFFTFRGHSPSFRSGVRNFDKKCRCLFVDIGVHLFAVAKRIWFMFPRDQFNVWFGWLGLESALKCIKIHF